MAAARSCPREKRKKKKKMPHLYACFRNYNNRFLCVVTTIVFFNTGTSSVHIAEMNTYGEIYISSVFRASFEPLHFRAPLATSRWFSAYKESKKKKSFRPSQRFKKRNGAETSIPYSNEVSLKKRHRNQSNEIILFVFAAVRYNYITITMSGTSRAAYATLACSLCSSNTP